MHLELSRKVLAYDLEKRSWEIMGDAPIQGRSCPGVTVRGERIYVWGGSGIDAKLNDGAVFDTGRREWQKMPEAPFASGAPKIVYP